MDVENEDLIALDESRCQNSINSSRCLYESKKGKKDHNKLKRTGGRFGINAIGFQGINCNSAIFFNKKNNSNNFAITLCKYQLGRLRNPEVLEIITNAIENPNLDITNIKLELLYNQLPEEEYYRLFDDFMEVNNKKLNAACKKYKINYYKVNKIQKEHLLDNLNNKRLINLMHNERKLNIVLDNARIHKSKVVEYVCDILSINLVFLPHYCPFLNPIENVWKDVKRIVRNSYYNDLDELINIFEDAFYDLIDSKSYYENWFEKFFA